MPDLFEQIVQFFESEGWPVEKVDGRTALRTGYEGGNGQWSCFATVKEDIGQFIFLSVCPHDIPPARYAAIGEYLHRANYGLPVGNFEIDLSDGHVRFKTSIELGDTDAGPALIAPIVYANVMVMNRYLPGILRVVQGTAPEQAIAEVEGA